MPRPSCTVGSTKTDWWSTCASSLSAPAGTYPSTSVTITRASSCHACSNTSCALLYLLSRYGVRITCRAALRTKHAKYSALASLDAAVKWPQPNWPASASLVSCSFTPCLSRMMECVDEELVANPLRRRKSCMAVSFQLERTASKPSSFDTLALCAFAAGASGNGRSRQFPHRATNTSPTGTAWRVGLSQ